MDVIFDIDGTLADASHRLHYIKQEKPDWKGFLSDREVAADGINAPIWQLLLMHQRSGHRILFVTGRPVSQLTLTWHWLRNRDCPVRELAHLNWATRRCPAPDLFMRANDDHRPSETVKRELLNEARAEGYDPVIAYEDRIKDAAMWRAEGLTCLHVAEGNY